MTDETYRIELPVSNEYWFFFNEAVAALSRKKAGVIGDRWRVLTIDFYYFIEAELEDNERIWDSVGVTLINDMDVRKVTLERETVETRIDQMKLDAWKKGVDEWRQRFAW